MTFTVTRKYFKEIRTRITNYRCFEQFFIEAFRESLTNNRSKEEFVHNIKGYNDFVNYVLKP